MAADTIPIKSRKSFPFGKPGAQGHWPLGDKPSRTIVIPILIGVLVGITSAFLIILQEWVALIALLLVIPATILLLVYPFISVLIWLALSPFFLQEFIPGTRYIFWMLHRMMIPAALGTTIILHFVGIRRIRPVRFGWVDLAVLAFIVLSIINIILLTDRPTNQIIRFYDRLLLPFGMFWLVRILAPGERELRWMVPVALLIIVSQGIIGLLSWFAPQLLPPAWLSRIGERTVGSFGNPAVYTTTLVFCILLLVQTAQASRSFGLRTAALVAIGIASFLVFFSFSRGSWLGTLLVFVGLAILYPRTILRTLLAGGLVAFILLTTSQLSGYTSFAQERLLTQTTAESRIIGNAATFRMIEAKPLQGWGFGNHELYDEQFKSSVFGVAVTEEQSSHNTYLLLTAEMGLPGLLLYLFPAAWLLLLSLKYRKWLPKEGMMGRAMLFMLWLLICDHFIVAIFTDLFQSNFYSTMVWWLVLAWIANIVDSARATAQNRRLGMVNLYGK